MPKVKLSRDARTDLRNIDNYTYQMWGRAQADKYVEMIEKGCRLLANHPTLGKPQDEFFP
ncbi:MAG: type II toxin-antitoxin system RelE/ParE family toxin, partial [bacterium]